MTTGPNPLSDNELATFDIAAMLRAGLTGDNDAAHRNLFGIGAVGAAVILDRVHTIPRSLTYLAEVVRAGGTHFAAGLPEPLPEAAQTAAAGPWLAAAAATGTSVDTDDALYR